MKPAREYQNRTDRTQDSRETLAQARAILKKAKAWYGKDELATDLQVLADYKPPLIQDPETGEVGLALVEIGTLTALEYESDKYDGKPRLWRHDVTSKHRLFLSPDGSTLVVWPPFRMTKRGIEG